MTFESLPQIIIQGYIFIRLKLDDSREDQIDRDADSIEATITALVISISLAIAHGLIEIVIIKI